MLLIPKILHTYWDRTPMSFLQALTVVSFRRLNPDWKINVYIPKQAYTGVSKYIPSYTGEDFFRLVEKTEAVNIIEVDLDAYGIDPSLHNILRSDILRYNKLYEEGGVWSDFDVLWLKPMSYFYNIQYYGNVDYFEDITAVVSMIRDTYGGHSIGVLIHSAGDEYIKSVLDLTRQVKPPFGHEVYGSTMISAAYPTLESLSKFKGLVAVKHETYYPYNIHPPIQTLNMLYLGNNLQYINDNVMCLHWYNGHVLSKSYVNSLSYTRKCSMTTLLKQNGYI